VKIVNSVQTMVMHCVAKPWTSYCYAVIILLLKQFRVNIIQK